MNAALDELAQRLRGAHFVADAVESHLLLMRGSALDPDEVRGAFDLLAREIGACVELLDEAQRTGAGAAA